MLCQASALAGGPGRMRQQLQQHLATLASFKGRSSAHGALALPPIGGINDDTDGEPEVGPNDAYVLCQSELYLKRGIVAHDPCNT